MTTKPSNLAKYKALAVLSVSVLLAIQVSGQASDGDDQFQVFHGDIGRISGISGNSNQPAAAPQTTILRQVQSQATAAPPTTFQAPRPVADRPVAQRQRGHQQQQQSTRRPRITLAVRTSAPIQSVAFSEPAVVATPPVQQQPPRQPLAELPSNSFTSSQLVAPPIPQALPQPQFQSIFSQSAPALDHRAQPAQSSFRSSPGHSNLVSARHSALIAEVAAERAAAAAQNQAEAFPQPSLGSPLEALSVSAVAQVQPPPTAALGHQALAAQPSFNFVNQPEEPIVAPSFEHVLGHGCPGRGVFSYENKDHCDRYYMCTNGTFTEEACPNGLAYSQMGAVYQHCAYNWNVDCGRKKVSEPLASPGCPWQFGIFPIAQAGQCSIDYFVCEWGVPETKRCSPEGLFYDDRIKGCQWADQLGCKSEALLNFKCPPEDEDNPYWPYPRYYHTKQDIIVCVNEQPRLVHCNEDQLVEPSSLACVDLKKKAKKKF